ncbi:MAG TPA: response regulator transcription factor [Elusimicrobiota bacterium]|nr:response regulator transcription factor [Elusimicrobiota bacterium]
MAPHSRLRVLVVDDEKDVNEMICLWLREMMIPDFDPIPALSLASAYAAVSSGTAFDGVILDRRLEDGDGLELLRFIRGGDATKHLPVIVLSGMDKEPEVIRGLEHGADEYLPKPCNYEMFRAKVRAVLRRNRPAAPTPTVTGPGFVLDPLNGRLTINGRVEKLEKKEAQILMILLRRPNVVHSAAFLCNEVWGTAKVPYNTLETRLSTLRRKLGAHAHLLETVRGSGYRILR